MEELTISYATMGSVFGRVKVYYAPQAQDGSFALFALADEMFITCLATGDNAVDFATNHQAASVAVSLPADAKVLGMIVNNTVLVKPRTADGRIRLAAEKSLATRTNFYVHNFCDPTTWYQQSIYIAGETPTDSGDHATYTLAHNKVIDICHAKITLEDYLVDGAGHSYKVAVTVNGTTVHEHSWPATTGADFGVDYVNGTITFALALAPTDAVLVTYHYVSIASPGTGLASRFTVSPTTGKKITVTHAKVSFSISDVVMNDSVCFEVWGIADYFLTSAQMTAMGIPPNVGYKILLQPFVYKTLVDFICDAHEIDVEIDAINGSGVRGSPDICNFDWDYVAATQFHSTSGMEIRIYLKHDVPLSGTLTRPTFYCISESEP